MMTTMGDPAGGTLDRCAGRIARAGGLLDAERIKLCSTRSFWWLCGLTELLVVGPVAVGGVLAPAGARPTTGTEFVTLGVLTVLVIAAVAVTDDFRHRTIRATFLAVPGRASALVAKAGVLAGACGLLGLVVAFGGRGVAELLRPRAGLAPAIGDQWRAVAGTGLVFAVTALVAVAVGLLVRHTLATVTSLLVWVLVVEDAIARLPGIGARASEWLPFANATYFLSASGTAPNGTAPGAGLADRMPFGPWASLGWFTACAVILLTVAVLTVRHRDA